MDRIIATFPKRLRQVVHDARGATAVEYALMASGVALAIMATVFTIGDKLKETFYDKLAAMF